MNVRPYYLSERYHDRIAARQKRLNRQAVLATAFRLIVVLAALAAVSALTRN